MKAGAVLVLTMKSNVVVFEAPRLSVPVRVMVTVPAVVGVPEKVQVAGSKVIPAGGAEEANVKFVKSENTFPGRV